MSDSITMEKSFAIGLVDSKLHFLKAEMEKILDKWGYSDLQSLLNDSKTGILKEAEDDAVSLKYLQKTIDELYDIKTSWG